MSSKDIAREEPELPVARMERSGWGFSREEAPVETNKATWASSAKTRLLTDCRSLQILKLK
jgi:hypothetical protein